MRLSVSDVASFLACQLTQLDLLTVRVTRPAISEDDDYMVAQVIARCDANHPPAAGR